MKAAILQGGRVINIIEVDSLDVLPGLLDAGDCSIGDVWDGSRFVSPQPVEAE